MNVPTRIIMALKNDFIKININVIIDTVFITHRQFTIVTNY